MATKFRPDDPRRPTNVSLSTDAVTTARELGISISRACERGLAAEVKAERERRWREEHRDKIDAYNAWIEEHGLPFSRYRPF